MSEPSAATRLPNEILERIFMQMGRSRDLNAASRVCRMWHHLSNPCLYEDIILKNEDDTFLFYETVCLENPALSHHTRQLSITNIHISRIVLARVLQCPWPRLKSLSLRKSTDEWWDFAGGLPFLSQLKHVELSGHTMPYISGCVYPELRILKLRQYGKSTTGQSLPWLPKLHKLLLDKVDLCRAQPDGLAAVAAACPEVYRLEFRGNTYGDIRRSTGFSSLINHMSGQLTILSFMDSTVNLDTSILTSIETLPKLQELTLELKGDFPAALSFPATLVYLKLRATSIEAEPLTSFLSDLHAGHVLPMLASIPYLNFENVTGDDTVMNNFKRQVDVAWNGLRGRGIPWETPKGDPLRDQIWESNPLQASIWHEVTQGIFSSPSPLFDYMGFFM